MNLVDSYTKALKALHKHNVGHLLVGGHAVCHDGDIQSTLDKDFWANTTWENLDNLNNTLLSFGYREEDCKETVRHLEESHRIKVAHEHNGIDLLYSQLIRKDFATSHKIKEIRHIHYVPVFIVSLNELTGIRRKSNRQKNLPNVKERITPKQIKNKQLLGYALREPEKGYCLSHCPGIGANSRDIHRG